MVINGINALLSLCFEGLVRRRAGAGVAQDQRPSEQQKKKYGSYYIWSLPQRPNSGYFACVGNYGTNSVSVVWPVSLCFSGSLRVSHANKRHDDCHPDDRRSDDGQLVCAAGHELFRWDQNSNTSARTRFPRSPAALRRRDREAASRRSSWALACPSLGVEM
jgi:hypothetical protein